MTKTPKWNESGSKYNRMVGWGLGTLAIIGLLIGIINPNTPSSLMEHQTAPAPTAEQVQRQAQRQAAILVLEKAKDDLVCPAFLDAPLGYKPCPEKAQLDRALALLRTGQ